MSKLIIAFLVLLSTKALAGDPIGTMKQWGTVDVTLKDAAIHGRNARILLLLRNNADKPESISSLLQFNNALSDEGDKGDMDFSGTKCDGDIPPHAVMKCLMGFTFPSHPKSVTLTVGVATKIYFEFTP